MELNGSVWSHLFRRIRKEEGFTGSGVLQSEHTHLMIGDLLEGE